MALDEKTKKLMERTRRLECDEDIATLNPKDVVNLKHRGGIVYDSTDGEKRMVFYASSGLSEDELTVFKIARVRLGATNGGMYHHMSPAFGDKHLNINKEDPKYEEWRQDLESLGLIK